MNRETKKMISEFNEERRYNLQAHPGPHELVIILDHLKPDFNIGKIFRSADAFGIREIHLIGVPHFHPASSKGSFRHVPAFFYENFEQSKERLNDYSFYCFEPRANLNLYDVKLSKKSAFIFGHEYKGISIEKSQIPKLTEVKIPQFGKVESLNVSIAAAISMYEYIKNI